MVITEKRILEFDERCGQTGEGWIAGNAAGGILGQDPAMERNYSTEREHADAQKQALFKGMTSSSHSDMPDGCCMCLEERRV